MKLENKKLQKEVSMRKKQIEILESEKSKHLEVNQIDKEKWLQEKDHLIYQMNMLTEKYSNN